MEDLKRFMTTEKYNELLLAMDKVTDGVTFAEYVTTKLSEYKTLQ